MLATNAWNSPPYASLHLRADCFTNFVHFFAWICNLSPPHRCPHALESIRARMQGREGRGDRQATRPPTVCNISWSNFNSVSIWKGGCSTSTSTKVIPVDHMSLRRAFCLPQKYFGCFIIHRHHFGCHWLFGRLVQTN